MKTTRNDVIEQLDKMVDECVESGMVKDNVYCGLLYLLKEAHEEEMKYINDNRERDLQ